jgi:ATP dependent DNA ligase domain
LARREQTARFIEPMECLPGEHIPEGDHWTYELKLDGYRIEAVKTGGKVTLYSRRGTDLSNRFEYVASALASLPDETVIDGELVALDEQGKPNFNLLQNSRSAESHSLFYAFDVLVRRGEDLMKQPLSKRREILATTVKPHDHVGISQVSNQTATEMLAFVESHGPRVDRQPRGGEKDHQGQPQSQHPESQGSLQILRQANRRDGQSLYRQSEALQVSREPSISGVPFLRALLRKWTMTRSL